MWCERVVVWEIGWYWSDTVLFCRWSTNLSNIYTSRSIVSGRTRTVWSTVLYCTVLDTACRERNNKVLKRRLPFYLIICLKYNTDQLSQSVSQSVSRGVGRVYGVRHDGLVYSNRVDEATTNYSTMQTLPSSTIHLKYRFPHNYRILYMQHYTALYRVYCRVLYIEYIHTCIQTHTTVLYSCAYDAIRAIRDLYGYGMRYGYAVSKHALTLSLSLSVRVST